MPPTRPIEDALWSRVVIGPADECWPWTAAKNGGYGVFKHATKKRWAHRAAWELANGPIPAGLKVLHECDNRPCCNPRHLRVGTQAENIADMVRKGRSADQSGEMNGNAKLTEAEVVAIRGALLDGAKQRDLAARFGVSKSLIGEIAAGRVWRGLGRAGPGGELVARIRTIKPSFWGNAKVSRCTNDARLLFVGLLNLADDEGRLLGSTRRIAGELFPHDDELEITTVEGWLGELKAQGLVEAYEVDEIGYLTLPGWHEHQRISHPAPSTLPNPSGGAPEPLRPEREQGRGKGTGKGKASLSRAPDEMTISESMHEFLRKNAPGIDYGRETSKFLDHHRAKGTEFKDWNAAWRTWMRNAHDWKRP